MNKCYLPSKAFQLTGEEIKELREHVRFLLSLGHHLEASTLRQRYFPLI